MSSIYRQSMVSSAIEFKNKAYDLGITTTDLSVSQNLYGVSIYFDGTDINGKVFKFRLSDHDCQRAVGVYTKLSVSSMDLFLFEYEKATYPERFEWEYLDKYINTPFGKKQVKKFLGRKNEVAI